MIPRLRVGLVAGDAVVGVVGVNGAGRWYWHCEVCDETGFVGAEEASDIGLCGHVLDVHGMEVE